MIAGSTGTSNFFSTALGAIVLLYFVLPSPDGLGVSKSLVGVTAGIIFSVASVGALIGVAISSRVARRIGVGPAIVGSMLIGGVSAIPYYLSGSLTTSPLFTLAGFSVNWSMLSIMAGPFITFIRVAVFNINQANFRPEIVPPRLQRPTH